MKFLLSTLFLTLLLHTSYAGFYDGDSKVVTLTKDNFKTLVLDSEEPWLVEFYANWCGHCKALAPEFNKAAKALSGIVNIGAVDMEAHRDVGSPYNVTGFPTLKYFGVDKEDPLTYDGERKKNEIVDYMLDKAREVALNRLAGGAQTGSVDVVQITNESVFQTVCQKQLCTIVFLPPLDESSTKDRKEALNVIKKTGISLTGRTNLAWVQGKDFEEFEAELNVLGEGYPQAVALDLSNRKFYNFKKSLTVDNLNDFVKSVLRKQESGSDITTLPSLVEVSEWNSKHDDL